MHKIARKAATLWLALQIILLSCISLCAFLGNSLAVLPITLHIRGTAMQIALDGNEVTLDSDSTYPLLFWFARPDPLSHEIQIDGTDSINNQTYDPAYFKKFSQTFYYKLEDWMRGGSLYDSWQDYTVIDVDHHVTLVQSSKPPVDTAIPLQVPQGADYDIQVQLGYPEATIQMEVLTATGTIYTLELDRNDRTLQIEKLSPDAAQTTQLFKTYFPEEPQPFLGELLLSCAHLLFMAWVLQFFCFLSGWLITLLTHKLHLSSPLLRAQQKLRAWQKELFPDHWVIRCLLLGSLGFTLFIVFYCFHAEPHFLDEGTYIFQARIFASGSLSAPIPLGYPLGDGSAELVTQGHWLTLFGPGTSLMLALGMLVHAPWLVEPLLGTAALWGVYRIARQWYTPAIAYLTLILLVLSPFYTFLAASYFSHTIGLFFLVYMTFFLQAYCRDLQSDKEPHEFYVCLAACCLGGAFATRELTAVIIGVILSLGIPLCNFWRGWKETCKLVRRCLVSARGKKLIRACLLYILVLAGCGLLYLAYNALQTGSPLLMPRYVFMPDDKYGFGDNIGFYGKHTVAAGLVILDQLFTSLQIELYGWPYLMTLAFLVLPFMLRKANRWDWLCLIAGVVLFSSSMGYYYHGLALGPRHAYEALPSYAMLTARGILVTGQWVVNWVGRLVEIREVASEESETVSGGNAALLAHWPVTLLVLVCIGCNLGYYLPRHIQVYRNFAGLPVSYHLNVEEIYKSPLHNAIVVTDDWYLFNDVLFGLNDPRMQGDVIYYLISGPADIQQLATYYPTRTFYKINVAPDGEVSYEKLVPYASTG